MSTGSDNLMVWAVLAVDVHASSPVPHQRTADGGFGRLKSPASVRASKLDAHDLFFGCDIMENPLLT